MKSYPVFIKTTNRRVVVVGNGEAAAQKARLFLKTDAELVLVAETPEAELEDMLQTGQAIRAVEGPSEQVFRDAAMVFLATDNPQEDERLCVMVRAAGTMVHVAGRADLSDLAIPSVVDRDPVIVAIGTDGAAPVLARSLKSRLESLLDPSLGRFAALAGRMRGTVAARMSKPQQRDFWNWAFTGQPWMRHKAGAEREAAGLLKHAVMAEQTRDLHSDGHISLVGAGPGARDLLTLRAVERLQQADVVFYDRLVDPDVLDMANPDARRIYVGKVVGASAWPQDKICRLIVTEALKGQRVVRLKSGDPAIFGRATEELDAARQAGVPCELVPGITAAMGAASAAGRSLTERGVADTLVFATGMCKPGDAAPDWSRHAHPGTAMAFYMSVAQSGQIVTSLLRAGMPAASPLTVAVDVSKTSQVIHETRLDQLTPMLAHNDITGCAIIIAVWPKDTALAQTNNVREPERLLA